MIPVPDVIQLVFRIPCVLRLPAFQMACNGSSIDFPCVGALEPNIAFGGQSLEIQREV